MGIKEDVDKFIETSGETDDLSDEVDQAIQSHITALCEAGYEEVQAEDLVFEALAWLIEKEIIPDTPDINAPDYIKLAWIESFHSQLPTRLAEQGVEFD
jgi:hypothetical protein